MQIYKSLIFVISIFLVSKVCAQSNDFKNDDEINNPDLSKSNTQIYSGLSFRGELSLGRGLSKYNIHKALFSGHFLFGYTYKNRFFAGIKGGPAI